jgi:hemolysin III
MQTLSKPPRHYPTPAAKCADLVVHIVALTFAFIGGGVLLGLSLWRGTAGEVAAVAVYAVGLVIMLGSSLAYNFARHTWRPLLRRLDHAAIFVMIAGSYTPFTTHSLSGAWAIWMTTAVWTIAALGVIGKLFLPGLGRGIWVAAYLLLGWLVLVAIKPMMQALSPAALILLAVGGAVYSVGVIFYLMQGLKFRRAIWHGHVLGGAGVHYAAVLIGVVLAGAAS